MRPILQALLIADHIYEDKLTGKKVIAGVFHRIRARSAPVASENLSPGPVPNSPAAQGKGGPSPAALSQATTTPATAGSAGQGPGDEVAPPSQIFDLRQLQRTGSPYAYISLTEIAGVAPLRLQCVDLKDNFVIFSLRVNVQAASPLDTLEVWTPLPEIPTGRGDHLALELLWENELLGSARITIVRS